MFSLVDQYETSFSQMAQDIRFHSFIPDWLPIKLDACPIKLTCNVMGADIEVGHAYTLEASDVKTSPRLP